jgi:hypothetical protein
VSEKARHCIAEGCMWRQKREHDKTEGSLRLREREHDEASNDTSKLRRQPCIVLYMYQIIALPLLINRLN